MFSLRCLSVSLREEERFEGSKKKPSSSRVRSYRKKYEERKKERKKEDEKKALGQVGIRFGFLRPKAHKKLLSSFSLDASVEEN